MIADTVDMYRFSYALSYSDDSLFGMLCLYSPSEYLATLREATDADKQESLADALQTVEIAESEPPPGSHYLKGFSYFLVRGNHVFVVQHVAVRANSLEMYLYDLLSAASVLSEESTFELAAALNLSEAASELREITSVELGFGPINRLERREAA